jgi:hypothetical protein
MLHTQHAGCAILKHINHAISTRNHPSHKLSPADWAVWRDSPEGLLDILRNPDLAIPPSEYIKDIQRGFKRA